MKANATGHTREGEREKMTENTPNDLARNP